DLQFDSHQLNNTIKVQKSNKIEEKEEKAEDYDLAEEEKIIALHSSGKASKKAKGKSNKVQDDEDDDEAEVDEDDENEDDEDNNYRRFRPS
ncbi:hypothetical protein NL529_28830, partial [Klebsiella pneumoniae]|nr:hypothetical protein [Klebsiella pneumoniae]